MRRSYTKPACLLYSLLSCSFVCELNCNQCSAAEEIIHSHTTKVFCSVFIRALNWILSQIQGIHSMSLHHILQDLFDSPLPFGFFLSDCLLKICIDFFKLPMLLLCSTPLMRLDVITLIISGEGCELWITFTCSSFSLLPRLLPLFPIFFAATSFEAHSIYYYFLWVKYPLSNQYKTAGKINLVIK
jgi:hypothetical protein